jgi:hypothetical protein
VEYDASARRLSNMHNCATCQDMHGYTSAGFFFHLMQVVFYGCVPASCASLPQQPWDGVAINRRFGGPQRAAAHRIHKRLVAQRLDTHDAAVSPVGTLWRVWGSVAPPAFSLLLLRDG